MWFISIKNILKLKLKLTYLIYTLLIDENNGETIRKVKKL